MGRIYKQLTIYERDRVEALWRNGHKQKEIARILKRNKSTISRELRKNGRYEYSKKKRWKHTDKYEAGFAQKKYQARRRSSKHQSKKIEKSNEIKEYIIVKLKKNWTPDQIAGRMKLELDKYVSSKTIYNWLYSSFGQQYCKYLPSNRYKPKRRRKKTERTLIPNRTGIEERSKFIDERKEYGHFEGDTIVSGKNTKSKFALVVIQERKSRFCQIKVIENLKPRSFEKATNRILKIFSNPQSLTLDNGIENTTHERIMAETYFCNPYSSWEKGSVENLNKMIRRFVLKRSNIADYSKKKIRNITNILNNKPRKILDYKTPREVALENNLLKKFD